MLQPSIVATLVIVVAATVAALTDVWKFKVYNALTIPLLVSGLLFHASTGGLPGLAGSLQGCLLGFGILIGLYIMGGVGAGDVKLLTALGAWLGPSLTFSVFVASAVCTGLYALVLMVITRSIKESVLELIILWHRLGTLSRHLGNADRIEQQVGRSDRRRRLIPFAAMIAIGVAISVALNWPDQGKDWRFLAFFIS